MPLKNRNSQIPNGMRFYCAVLKWSSPPGASFNVICEGYAMAVRGNMGLAKQRGLPTSMTDIQNAVDAYNSAICKQNGWDAFITEGGAAAQHPFSNRSNVPVSLTRSLPGVAAGGEVLVEWIASRAEAVPQEQANKRAEICAACPLNEKGDWTRWFTRPLSEAIRGALNLRGQMNLSTPFDDKLNICGACACPLRLKVHMPFEKFFPKMSAEAKDALDVKCWIRSEMK